jgi:uncharacterized membrane protein YecN with MAPEG domain
MEFVTIVVMLALVEYNFFAFQVGLSRVKYNVKAPAISGNLDWERLYRVQCNTLEQLIVFIPCIYGFAYFLSSTWAAGIGVFFIIGRMLFFIGYKADASKRTPGFLMTFFTNQILLIGTIVGCVMSLIK